MCLQLYKCTYYVHEKKHQCPMTLPCLQSRAAPSELLMWPGLDKGCPEHLLPPQEVAQILSSLPSPLSFCFGFFFLLLEHACSGRPTQGMPSLRTSPVSFTQAVLPAGASTSAKQCMKPHSPEKSFPQTKALSCLCTGSLSNREIHPDLTPQYMGVLLSLVMNHPGETVAGHPTRTTPVSGSERRIISSLQTCRAQERYLWILAA